MSDDKKMKLEDGTEVTLHAGGGPFRGFQEAPDMPERRTVYETYLDLAAKMPAGGLPGMLAGVTSEAVENLRNRCDTLDTEHAEFAENTASAIASLRAIVEAMQSAYEMRIASLENRVLVLESRLGLRIMN